MKPILLFLAFLLLASPSFAQNKRRTQESTRVYLELGPGLMWLSGEMAPGMEGSDTRPHVGLGFTRPFSGPVYTHTGIFVARKGSSRIVENAMVNGQVYPLAEVQTDLDYVIVPYMLRVEVGNRIRWYAEGGGFGAFLAQGNVVATASGNTRIETNDISDTFKRYDAGFVVGSGVQATFLDDFAVSLGARYQQGLIDIAISPLTQGTSNFTNALDLNIGIGMWLGSGLK